MADSEKPRMRKFQTELSKYATIQKERAKYLSMTLEEKMEKSRMRGRVLRLDNIPSWAEQRRQAKKSRGSPTDLADKVSLFQGDITKLAIGAICNAANRSLLGGGGVDGAIHRAAGSRLYRECESLNGCNTGEAKMTAGYLLPANYVIHTVGPIVHSHYRGVDSRNEKELASCYRSCLNVVLEHNRKQRQNLKDRSLARSSEDTKDAKKTSSEVQTASKGEADETTNNTSEANEKKEKSRNGNNKETSSTVSKELSETNTPKTEDQGSTGGEDSGVKTEPASAEGGASDVSGESKMEVDASSSEEAKPEGQEVDSAKSETSSTESGGDEKKDAEGKTASEDVKSDKVESMDVSPVASSEGQKSHPQNIQPLEPLIDSIAFPCISTGIYGYPQEAAAQVALRECRDWLKENPDEVKRIIFCVFLDSDYDIYEELLPKYFPQGGLKDDTSSASPDEDNDKETKEDSPKKDKKDPKQETQV